MSGQVCQRTFDINQVECNGEQMESNAKKLFHIEGLVKKSSTQKMKSCIKSSLKGTVSEEPQARLISQLLA